MILFSYFFKFLKLGDCWKECFWNLVSMCIFRSRSHETFSIQSATLTTESFLSSVWLRTNRLSHRNAIHRKDVIKKGIQMWMLQIFLWNFLFTTISHCIDDKSIFQLRFESGLSRPRTAGGRRGLQMPSSMQTMQTVVCKVLQRSQEYMRRDQVHNSLIVYSSQCHCTSVQTVTRPYINMIFILIMLHMRRLH